MAEPPWTTPRSRGKKRYRYFTRFDEAEISRCLDYLAPSDDEDARERDIVTLKRWCRHIGMAGYPALKFRFIPGAILTLVGIAIAISPSYANTSREHGFDFSILFVGLLFVIVGSFLSAIGFAVLTARLSRLKFHHNVALALKAQKRTYPSSPTYSLNLIGKAARELFRASQWQRLTWISPPTAADRALAISYPLINVRLSPEYGSRKMRELLESYTSFLYFASALEAAKRTELIPKLRAYYAGNQGLDYRSDPRLDSIAPERDALFLDPMRNHNRWGIAKDYLFPLASWLSFLVSATALTVTIAK